ncbi:MAG: type II toxin-antitoxin system PemK/MazF family toxin [Nitrospinae bacterium]|nr:type II toxin-antitoxin system PemK/MazF family toxin [Nitrospinota bacterium]
MTPYKRGEVILVPFPFSDQTAAKKRPAVVISSSRYNAISKDIIIMAVTSKTDKPFDAGSCVIKEWKKANLLKPSVVKPAVSPIEQTLVLKRLGTLSADDSNSLDGALKELFEL